MNATAILNEKVNSVCYHCGENCKENLVKFEEHDFCCEGCANVYDILKESNLCRYYTIDGTQGITPDKSFYQGKFDYLDDPATAIKLMEFSDGTLSRINWVIPKMHCSSCIWLLENLSRINPAIRGSVVNFPEKSVRVTFNCNELKLSELATILSRIGYEPYISLNDLEATPEKKWNRKRLYKIGIAGFAFGNIMMLSFPEYLDLGQSSEDQRMRTMFNLLNLVLILPVLLYSASEFFVSAWSALKGRYLNIDAPIALAFVSVFGTSLYQIVTESGPGYFDSLAGAVFFMLIGRYFQDKTYASISFDRDYKSYFPVAVTVLENGKETRRPVNQIEKENIIRIRNQELIPADSVLLSEKAYIDYSFVTGEAVPVEISRGEIIYAGGRQTGAAITLKVIHKVSQSHLTQLWNNDAFSIQKDDQNTTLAARINRYFSAVVLTIAFGTLLFWLMKGQSAIAFNAFATVLLVACPCALLLSSTFTNGNMLALFGRHKLYPKNSHTIERLSKIDTIVFDKTGTLTKSDTAKVQYEGSELTDKEKYLVRSLASQSSHPLSRLLVSHLSIEGSFSQKTDTYEEIPGCGSIGNFGEDMVQLGSAKWLGKIDDSDINGSQVWVKINDVLKGVFKVNSQYRSDLENTVERLHQEGYETYLLSGDNPIDVPYLTGVFGDQSLLHFNQKPHDKLRFIKYLQEDRGRKVLMVGDGLNDAGALMQSEVGMAVSDDTNNFSPACDAIIEGEKLSQLPSYVKLARGGQTIIKLSFAVSLLYNLTGVSFAITGELSPVIAAILMPMSSITIVSFTTIASALAVKKYLKPDEGHVDSFRQSV